MFEGLQESQLEGALEALLFVTDEPASAITLADMLEVEPAEAEAALGRLRERLVASGGGIVLREVAGGWRLYTHPAYHELVERYVLSWDTRKLSQAALETLAIVAYSQPVTRARIAAVRGVNSDSSVNSLVEKGLLREAGVEDSPGNPVLYATTRTFLEKFGLRSTADLPPLETFAPDEETRRFVAERLGAARTAVEHGAVDASGAGGVEGRAGEETARAAARAEGEGSADEGPLQEALFDGDAPAGAEEAMRQTMLHALGQASGAVEKIDFNELRFED
ncbi:MAG TPA: SMC-Scp complex subunit ScpB [Candidatus Aveggerthella excrementigallinarum]|nr:SMC-Scp complex subunit ScpB [Candidatus Aveggerthella excrementigallinarum]